MMMELNKYGIKVKTCGQIYYNSPATVHLNCDTLYLLRHAETFGIRNNKFMSDTSKNSQLTEEGIRTVCQTAAELERLNFDYILYSNIPRVRQTAEIVQYQLCSKETNEYQSCFVEIPWLKGIDNAGWEEKGSWELKGEDAKDFYQREILHNVFAKSTGGNCWAQVLLRCGRLIKYINENYYGKRVLLISQGSILMGIQIILHINSEPWNDYNPEDFFGLKNKGLRNYGKLHQIFIC